MDKAILFTTTPHVERAATATLDAIGAEMQVLYQLLADSYSPEARIAKMKDTILELNQTIPGCAGAILMDLAPFRWGLRTTIPQNG